MKHLRPFALCCSLLALISLSTRADDNDAAAAAIQKAGGRIERDDKAEGKPIVVAYFGATDLDDNGLDTIKGQAKLRKLTLNGTKITDAGLEKLKGLKELKKLYLVDTKITDAGLDHLKDLAELRTLSLVGTAIDDAGLEKIKGMTNLEELFLAGTKVTDDGVKKLKEALPKLKVER